MMKSHAICKKKLVAVLGKDPAFKRARHLTGTWMGIPTK
jgi:hypothetical protein